MAINNETFLLVFAIILVYITIYKRNKLVGGVIMFSASLATLLLVDGQYAVILIATSVIIIIVDGLMELLPTKPSQYKRMSYK